MSYVDDDLYFALAAEWRTGRMPRREVDIPAAGAERSIV